ncbi:hypothetical protein C2845_PM05G21520 [Panicum miliaceum]|uniref:Uncharacterized protein n=1 Tax=Panicum miliaceum TaxID=4540 RepID=A0A3L6T1E1_PANMI|nr:hypothetical protein C2845_PM05G21520 [Panicum miliaceum]
MDKLRTGPAKLQRGGGGEPERAGPDPPPPQRRRRPLPLPPAPGEAGSRHRQRVRPAQVTVRSWGLDDQGGGRAARGPAAMDELRTGPAKLQRGGGGEPERAGPDPPPPHRRRRPLPCISRRPASVARAVADGLDGGAATSPLPAPSSTLLPGSRHLASVRATGGRAVQAVRGPGGVVGFQAAATASCSCTSGHPRPDWPLLRHARRRRRLSLSLRPAAAPPAVPLSPLARRRSGRWDGTRVRGPTSRRRVAFFSTSAGSKRKRDGKRG